MVLNTRWPVKASERPIVLGVAERKFDQQARAKQMYSNRYKPSAKSNRAAVRSRQSNPTANLTANPSANRSLNSSPSSSIQLTEATKGDNGSVRFATKLPSRTRRLASSQNSKSPAMSLNQTGSIVKRTGQSAKSKIYVVKDGDSVANIAIKFYGQKKGNKLATIKKIVAANKKSIKSADKIFVGQKLIMPSLNDKVQLKLKPKSRFTRSNSQYRTYIVKEGDSLWQIAQQKLGNGARYVEISRLNRKTIADGNELTIGDKIRLPLK